MKNKNEFKSSQAYIRILILCFGVFFSSNAFSFDCYDDYYHYSGSNIICTSGISKSYTWLGGSDYVTCTINGSTGCTEAGVSDTSKTCPDGSETFINFCPDPPPPLFDCWDGSTAPDSASCPVQPPPPVVCYAPEIKDPNTDTCVLTSSVSDCGSLSCPADAGITCISGNPLPGAPASVLSCLAPTPEDSNTAEQCKADDFYWDDNNSSCLAACPDGMLAGADNLCFDKPPFYPDCPSGTYSDGTCKPVIKPKDPAACPDGFTPIFEPYTGENMCKEDSTGKVIDTAPAFCGQEYSTGATYTCKHSTNDKNCADFDLNRRRCEADPLNSCGSSGQYTVVGECRDDGTDNGWIGILTPPPEDSVTPVNPTLKDCGDGVFIPTDKTCPVKETPVKPTPDQPTTTDPYQPPSGGDGDGTGGDGGDNSTPTGGTGDTTKPTSSPVGIETPPNAPVNIDNPNVDPCASGGCDSTGGPDFPTDYARQQTLQANVQVNQAIGQLINSIRFNELASMKKFTQDSSNSLDVIEQYQALNQDKMQAIKNELGLQRIDDVAFYKLATKGVEQSNTELKNIYNLIDWSQNKLIESAHDRTKLLSEIKNTSDTDLKIQQEQLKELQKISDANNSASNNSDELLKTTKEIKDTLQGALKDDGTALDVGSTDVDLGTDTGDFSGLDGMGLDTESIKQGITAKLSDQDELNQFDTILNAIIPGASSLYTTLPSTSCTQEFTQPFTIQGKTRQFSLDVCGRLADLKIALAWIFGFYASRTAFNNIFAPKAA